MKKRYTISQKKLPEADEPVAVYNSTKQIVSDTLSEIPEGHVTLEQFGKHFHQKLDDCYAKMMVR